MSMTSYTGILISATFFRLLEEFVSQRVRNIKEISTRADPTPTDFSIVNFGYGARFCPNKWLLKFSTQGPRIGRGQERF